MNEETSRDTHYYLTTLLSTFRTKLSFFNLLASPSRLLPTDRYLLLYSANRISRIYTASYGYDPSIPLPVSPSVRYVPIFILHTDLLSLSGPLSSHGWTSLRVSAEPLLVRGIVWSWTLRLYGPGAQSGSSYPEESGAAY